MVYKYINHKSHNYLSVKVVSTAVPIVDTELANKLNRNLLKMPTDGTLVSCLNQNGYLQDTAQIHLVAGRRIWTQDLWITNPAP